MAPNTKKDAPPLLAHTVSSVRRSVDDERAAGRKIALIPTMGALHAGHISLIEAAAVPDAYLVVSIYVNPTQFGPSEDLSEYPHTLQADIEACRKSGVDLIFAPNNSVMYPPDDRTRIRPGPLAETLCGRFRPGHFEGVCTVVAKLLNIVRPDVAYFGQKDAQQALIIRRMVADLHLPVQIEICPIVRESDGLAMSSRNANLAPEERARALNLNKALVRGREMLLAGERNISRITDDMRQTVEQKADTSSVVVEVDYLSIVDAETLQAAAEPAGRLMLAGAIRVGRTRLIDNLVVDLSGKSE